MKKLMRRLSTAGVAIALIATLTGCLGREDVVDYVSVKFDGYNTAGAADFTVDKKLYKDALGVDISDSSPRTSKDADKVSQLQRAIHVSLNKTSGLSNGDKVTVTVSVDEDKADDVQGGAKTIEVSGLQEPQRLTNEEAEKHLVLNFSGVNGRGSVKMDNTFDKPFSSVNFKVENDGKLSNGDTAKVGVSDKDKEKLLTHGYALQDDFAPSFEVKGLAVTAADATDIANRDDITRMIDEGIHRKYKDFDAGRSYGHRYEISDAKLMYRQFEKESDTSGGSGSGWFSSGAPKNGTLLKIVTVKRFSGGAEAKLEESKTAIFGFTNIFLDDQKKANVADIDEISDQKDDTYSLESVIKLYEGYGYTEVK